MKILEKYILKEYIRLFLLSFAFFVGLVIIVRLGDREIGDLISGDKTAWYVFRRVIFRAPERIMQVFPAAALMAIFFTFGRLIQTNQLTAMKATGMSYYRMITPLLVATIGICIVAIVFNDQVASRANRKVAEMENKQDFRHNRNIIFITSGNKVVFIRKMDSDTNTLDHVTIETFDGNSLKRSIYARVATWNGKDWTLFSGVEREFRDGKVVDIQYFDRREVVIDADPRMFRKSAMRPNELSYFDLRKMAKYKLEAGQPIRTELVGLNHKIAYPFATFVVVLIGAPLAIWFGSAGYAAGFLITMFVNFLYWGVGIAIFEAMGQNGALPPALSCWAGNILFGAVGTVLLMKAIK